MKELDNGSNSSSLRTLTLTNGTSYITISPPSVGSYILTLPTTTGSAGQVFTSNGAGSTYWSSITSGTVTSVGLSVPSIFTVRSAPITTSGNIDLVYSGSALPPANGGTGLTTVGADNTVLTIVAGTPTWQAPATSGTVTSVAASVPAFLSVTGTPITSSGTLAITLSGTALPPTNGGTGLTTVGANNTVLTIIAGTPTWQAPATSGTVTSVSATVPSFLSVTGTPITSSGTLAISLSGTALPPANGGTGLTTVGANNTVLTIVAGTPTWQAPATSGTVTSVSATVPSFLSVTGTPITSSGTLAITLSGTALPPANGGTGLTTVGADNTILTIVAGTPTWQAPATSGTVTSISMTVPSFLSVTPATITSTGTFAITGTSTGTGTTVVLNTSPTLVTPILGVASATSISFPANLTSNKIVMYGTAPNAFQFDGFGTASNTLRYQVSATTSSHVFYAGTSTTTDQEVFRIYGTGGFKSTGNGYINNNAAGVSYPLEILNSDTTVGNVEATTLGQARGNGNGLQTSFAYQGSNNAANTCFFGFSGSGKPYLQFTNNGTAQFGNCTITSPTFTTPALGVASATSLSLSTALAPGSGGTGLTTVGANNTVLTVVAGTPTWQAPATSGTVTSVSMTVPAWLSVTPATITSTGTFAITGTSTGTGTTVVLNTSPTITSPTIIGPITNTLAAGAAVTNFAPLTAGQNVLEWFGTGLSNNNCIATQFNYAGPGSTSNCLTFGYYGGASCMSLYPNGTSIFQPVTLTTPLATSSGGTGVIAASTGTGGVVLNTSPTLKGAVTIGDSTGAVNINSNAATKVSISTANSMNSYEGSNIAFSIQQSSTNFGRMVCVSSNGYFSTSALAGDTVIACDSTHGLHILNGNGAAAISISNTNVPTIRNATLNSPNLVTPNIGAASGTSLGLTGALSAATVTATPGYGRRIITSDQTATGSTSTVMTWIDIVYGPLTSNGIKYTNSTGSSLTVQIFFTLPIAPVSTVYTPMTVTIRKNGSFHYGYTGVTADGSLTVFVSGSQIIPLANTDYIEIVINNPGGVDRIIKGGADGSYSPIAQMYYYILN